MSSSSSSVSSFTLAPQDCKKFLSDVDDRGYIKNTNVGQREYAIRQIIALSKETIASEKEASEFLEFDLKREVKIISASLKALTSPAEDRQKAKTLKAEVKELRRNAKVTVREAEKQKFEKQLTQLKKELEQKTTELDAQEEKFTKAKEEKTDLSQKLEDSQKETQEIRSQIDANLEEIKGLNSRLESSVLGKEQLLEQCSKLSDEIETLKQENSQIVHSHKEQLEAFKDGISEKETQATELKRQISEKESEISKLKDDLQESKNKVNTLEKALEEKSQQIRVQSEEISKGKTEKDRLEKELNGAITHILRLKKTCAEAVSANIALKTKDQESQKQIQVLTAEKADLADNLVASEKIVEEIKGQLEKKQQAADVLKKLIDEQRSQLAKEKLSTTLAGTSIATLKASESRLENEIRSLKSQLTTIDSEKEGLSAELRKEKAKILEIGSEITKKEREIQSFQKKVESLEKELEEQLMVNSGLIVNLSQSRFEANQKEQQLQELLREMKDERSKAAKEKAELSGTLASLKFDIERYKRESMLRGGIEAENEELKGKLTQNHEQISNLERLVKEKDKENLDLETKLKKNETLILSLMEKIDHIYQAIRGFAISFGMPSLNFSKESGPSDVQLNDLNRRAAAASKGQTPKEQKALKKARDAKIRVGFLEGQNRTIALENAELQKQLRQLQKEREEEHQKALDALSKAEGKEPVGSASDEEIFVVEAERGEVASLDLLAEKNEQISKLEHEVIELKEAVLKEQQERKKVLERYVQNLEGQLKKQQKNVANIQEKVNAGWFSWFY